MNEFDKLTRKHQATAIEQHFPLIIEGDNGEKIKIDVRPKAEATDLPAGAKLRSTPMDIAESLLHLKDNIAVIAEQVKQALAEHQPEEWGVEFHIGFKAEGGIPFIAKGEANSALKISAKWKKDPTK